MFIKYQDTILTGQRGPAGPDGNPLGTIISYMGTTAPTDYLICDGQIYTIDQYPELAEFITTQFGSLKYFGGDGTTTFAVPDMRNLFLRGYHGTASDKLSGDVGKLQNATEHMGIYIGKQNGIGVVTNTTGTYLNYANPDKRLASGGTKTRGASGSSNGSYDSTAQGPYNNERYTARPVNMAVLYCIKAVPPKNTIMEDVVFPEHLPEWREYSLEETRIGTWVDTKPIYRKMWTYNKVITSQTSIQDISSLKIDTLIKTAGGITGTSNTSKILVRTFTDRDTILGLNAEKTELRVYLTSMGTVTLHWAAVEYTKTTD